VGSVALDTLEEVFATMEMGCLLCSAREPVARPGDGAISWVGARSGRCQGNEESDCRREEVRPATRGAAASMWVDGPQERSHRIDCCLGRLDVPARFS